MLGVIAISLVGPGAAQNAPYKKTRLNERAYQEKWCRDYNGQVEVVFVDRTRCDCLTDTHAVEVEFARKWKEAIGQALHYARKSGKKPGVVLIIRNKNDYKYWKDLNKALKYHRLDIDTWLIDN